MNDFNTLLRDNLEGTISRIKYRRYDNDLERLVYLNELVGLNYITIGKFLNKSHGTVYNYLHGKNKINDKIKIDLERLLKYSISIFEQMASKRSDLTPANLKCIEETIYKGKVLLKPALKNAKLKRTFQSRGVI